MAVADSPSQKKIHNSGPRASVAFALQHYTVFFRLAENGRHRPDVIAKATDRWPAIRVCIALRNAPL